MWYNLDYLLSQIHVKIAPNLLNFARSFTKLPLHWVTSLTLDRLCSSLPQGQGWGCPQQQQGSSSSFCRAWTTLWGQSCSGGLHCGFQPDCFLFKRLISNSPQCRKNTHAEISLKLEKNWKLIQQNPAVRTQLKTYYRFLMTKEKVVIKLSNSTPLIHLLYLFRKREQATVALELKRETMLQYSRWIFLSAAGFPDYKAWYRLFNYLEWDYPSQQTHPDQLLQYQLFVSFPRWQSLSSEWSDLRGRRSPSLAGPPQSERQAGTGSL